MLDLILKILGIGAIVVMAIIAFIGLKFYLGLRKLNNAMNELGPMADLLGENLMSPSMLKLKKVETGPQSAETVAAIDFLEDNGWQFFQTYALGGSGITMHAGHQIGRGYAVVYEREGMGTWIDLAAVGTDDIDYTASNTPTGHELEQPPWAKKVFLPGESNDKVLNAWNELVAGKDLVEEGPNDFEEHFATATQKEQEWMLTRGGPSDAEMLRIAANMGEEIDEDDLALPKSNSTVIM